MVFLACRWQSILSRPRTEPQVWRPQMDPSAPVINNWQGMQCKCPIVCRVAPHLHTRAQSSLPTVSPRCRCGRACVLRWSLGLCMRYSHSCLTSPRSDSRPSGTRVVYAMNERTVEVRFRDASAHQTCLCKRPSDGVTLEEESTSLNKAKLELATREGPDIGPTVCQSRGNRSNEIPWTWHQEQLKEWAEFLVSRSLTLSSAHEPHTVGGSRHLMIS